MLGKNGKLTFQLEVKGFTLDFSITLNRLMKLIKKLQVWRMGLLLDTKTCHQAGADTAYYLYARNSQRHCSPS